MGITVLEVQGKVATSSDCFLTGKVATQNKDRRGWRLTRVWILMEGRGVLAHLGPS